MADLHATWIPEGRLFFWSGADALGEAVERELPALERIGGTPTTRHLAVPGAPTRRRRVQGIELTPTQALPALCTVPRNAAVSDSLRCWSRAALLGLELAARQRVAPGVDGGVSRWRVLLNRKADRDRFDALARSLPTISRAFPTRDRGPVRVSTADAALKSFLDFTVDGLYRQKAVPGSARGWAQDLAESLCGEASAFNPRDARFQSVPELVAAWSRETETAGLRVGFGVSLPRKKSGPFQLELWTHPPGRPNIRVPLDRAWRAGASLEISGETWYHPAHAVLRDLARAARLCPALGEVLSGPNPHGLAWDARQVWSFLRDGVGPLREAGYEVSIPAEFAAAGTHRIRARMCIAADAQGGIDLSEALRFRWEVVLGDRVMDGAEFAELTRQGQPIVLHRGEWVLLDPDELARLPQGLLKEGTLSGAEALRAVLTGEHDGVPVVADDRLRLVMEALRNPPDEPLPKGLQATLRPYQARGYAWLATLGRLGLGACLADDMGLGKTVQLIAHLLRRKHERRTSGRPTLVVCPTSVLGNWMREIARFAPALTVLRHHGLTRDADALGHSDVVLTTYGLLVRDREVLGEIEWDVVCLDEAQSIKNPDSQRARSARKLRAKHRIALTGTPVENRLDELWSLMEFLVPGLLGPRATFRRKVAVPVERFGDEEVARRLKLGVSPFLLRRLKSDPTVISDLPEKIEKSEWCSLTPEQARLYEQIVEEELEGIQGASEIERRGRVLAMLTRLKQVCNHPAQVLGQTGPLGGRSGKLERCADLVDATVANRERLLVFTQYREMGELLVRHLGASLGNPVPFLHGGTPMQHRDEMVRAFQEDERASPVLVISLRAGGTGLNLTRATRVVHYDRWWNPAVEDQATDRAYRIGQRRNVQVHKLVCQGTLEERIDTMLEDKRALAESVVGSGERWVTELDDSALRALVSLGQDAVVED